MRGAKSTMLKQAVAALAAAACLCLGFYFLPNLVKSVTSTVISPITAKMPSIPCPVMSSAISRFVIVRSSLTHELRHEIEDHAACEHRCDLTGDVRADGVHQQVIGAVRFLPHLLDNARGHREGRDTGRTDHWIHLILAEEVESFFHAGRYCTFVFGGYVVC